MRTTDVHQIIYVKRILRDVMAITSHEGESVANAITTDGDLTLDFSGITICAVPFFAALIGDRFELFARVKIVNATATIEQVFRRVLKNNREYFTDERVRRAVAAILAEAEADL